jgi:hypothetical protein
VILRIAHQNKVFAGNPSQSVFDGLSERLLQIVDVGIAVFIAIPLDDTKFQDTCKDEKQFTTGNEQGRARRELCCRHRACSQNEQHGQSGEKRRSGTTIQPSQRAMEKLGVSKIDRPDEQTEQHDKARELHADTASK